MILTAVKNCSILHGRVFVKSPSLVSLDWPKFANSIRNQLMKARPGRGGCLFFFHSICNFNFEVRSRQEILQKIIFCFNHKCANLRVHVLVVKNCDIFLIFA